MLTVDEQRRMMQSEPESTCVRCYRWSTTGRGAVFVNTLLIGGVLSYAFCGSLVFKHLEEEQQFHDHWLSRNQTHDCLVHVINQTRLRQHWEHRVGEAVLQQCIDGRLLIQPDWTLTQGFIYSYASITTLGYGRLTVVTRIGRIFYLLYGLVGIPLAMICLANLGQFVREYVIKLTVALRRLRRRRRLQRAWLLVASHKTARHHQQLNGNVETGQLHLGREQQQQDEDEDEEADTEQEMSGTLFLVMFLAYMCVGALLLPAIKGHGDFIDGLYYQFMALTADFRDVIPKDDIPEALRSILMPLSILYITAGIAVSTIAIETGAVQLKRLHNVGRSLKNVGSVKIWFGGKRLAVNDLVESVCVQCDVPLDKVRGLNLTELVVDSIAASEQKQQEMRSRQPSSRRKEDERPLLPLVTSCDAIADSVYPVPVRVLESVTNAVPSSERQVAVAQAVRLDDFRLPVKAFSTCVTHSRPVNDNKLHSRLCQARPLLTLHRETLCALVRTAQQHCSSEPCAAGAAPVPLNVRLQHTLLPVVSPPPHQSSTAAVDCQSSQSSQPHELLLRLEPPPVLYSITTVVDCRPCQSSQAHELLLAVEPPPVLSSTTTVVNGQSQSCQLNQQHELLLRVDPPPLHHSSTTVVDCQSQSCQLNQQHELLLRVDPPPLHHSSTAVVDGQLCQSSQPVELLIRVDAVVWQTATACVQEQRVPAACLLLLHSTPVDPADPDQVTLIQRPVETSVVPLAQLAVTQLAEEQLTSVQVAQKAVLQPTDKHGKGKTTGFRNKHKERWSLHPTLRLLSGAHVAAVITRNPRDLHKLYEQEWSRLHRLAQPKQTGVAVSGPSHSLDGPSPRSSANSPTPTKKAKPPPRKKSAAAMPSKRQNSTDSNSSKTSRR